MAIGWDLWKVLCWEIRMGEMTVAMMDHSSETGKVLHLVDIQA